MLRYFKHVPTGNAIGMAGLQRLLHSAAPICMQRHTQQWLHIHFLCINYLLVIHKPN